MSYTATGVLHHIGQTQQVNDRFKKREFVLRIDEEVNGNVYSQHVQFQVAQNKCDMLNNYAAGQEVTVNFNLRGREFTKDNKTSYFNTLDCWKIESTGAKPRGNGVPDIHQQGYNPEPDETLPF